MAYYLPVLIFRRFWVKESPVFQKTFQTKNNGANSLYASGGCCDVMRYTASSTSGLSPLARVTLSSPPLIMYDKKKMLADQVRDACYDRGVHHFFFPPERFPQFWSLNKASPPKNGSGEKPKLSTHYRMQKFHRCREYTTTKNRAKNKEWPTNIIDDFR